MQYRCNLKAIREKQGMSRGALARKIEVLNQVPDRQVRRLVSKALDKPEKELWPEERYGDQ